MLHTVKPKNIKNGARDNSVRFHCHPGTQRYHYGDSNKLSFKINKTIPRDKKINFRDQTQTGKWRRGEGLDCSERSVDFVI